MKALDIEQALCKLETGKATEGIFRAVLEQSKESLGKTKRGKRD